MEEEKAYQGKEISVSQRQIYILSLLSQNPMGYRAEEIRERLKAWDIEVSKRTISRDIDELSLNYGIGEEERGGKTYYYADKYTLKNVDFTIEDLASLAFAREMLTEYEHLEMGRHAVAFINKIVENSASLNRLQFEKLCRHFKRGNEISGGVDEVDGATERKIQNAIDGSRKIEMEYYSFSSDVLTKRVIHPYRMLVIDSYLCVEGYCERRKEIRRFRLSRIKSINLLDEKFQTAEADGENGGMPFLKLGGGEPEDIELIFTGDCIRYVKEYEAGRAKRIKETGEGLYFYQKAPVAPDVIRWIRSFGPEVKVVKPKWLDLQLEKEAGQRLRDDGFRRESSVNRTKKE